MWEHLPGGRGEGGEGILRVEGAVARALLQWVWGIRTELQARGAALPSHLGNLRWFQGKPFLEAPRGRGSPAS